MLLGRFVAPHKEKESLFFLFAAGGVNWSKK